MQPKFKLLSVAPCDIEGVYAVDSEKYPGKYHLESWPLFGVGVAQITCEWNGVYNGIVGIHLGEGGEIDITDNCSNFAGLMKSGGDPYKVSWKLSNEYYDKIVREDGTPWRSNEKP